MDDFTAQNEATMLKGIIAEFIKYKNGMDKRHMSSMTMSDSMNSTDGSMSMGSGMMMGMDSMAMTFFTSSSTPLYSSAWTPTTPGQYAGTCIFLIIFAAIFRGLLAFRVRFFEVLAVYRRRQGQHFQSMVAMDEKCPANARPWRANEAVMVAFLDMVLAGVSYLLMLAVMTMNVGYFLSILAGVFIGSLIFGHLTANSAAH